MSPLYRIHTGGTLARHEPNGLKLYEIGHTIELDHEEAARLNEGRSLANSRVVRVGGEIETTTPKPIRESPEVVHVEVAAPGTPSADELIAMGADPALIKVARARESVERELSAAVPPIGSHVEFTDEPPTPVAHIEEPEPRTDLADSADDIAPDWPTYLASVDARTAAEALRGLESADDVQAAMDAEAAKGGLQRPLVIRAGNAALRRLRKG